MIWPLTGRRVGLIAAAGGLTGLGLIVSYYCLQWQADGWHSAEAQFTQSAGIAWVAASVVGGALIGGLGAWAGCSAQDRPIRKALGLSTAGLVLGLGPILWFVFNGEVVREDWNWVVVAFYATVGSALGLLALLRCGTAPFLRGLALAAVSTVAALGALLALQSTVLYTTF